MLRYVFTNRFLDHHPSRQVSANDMGRALYEVKRRHGDDWHPGNLYVRVENSRTEKGVRYGPDGDRIR